MFVPLFQKMKPFLNVSYETRIACLFRKSQCSSDILLRLPCAIQLSLRNSAIEVCPGIIRIEADGDIIICDGGEVLTEVALRKSAIVVCPGIIRIEADGDIIICDGGEVLTEEALRISAIVVCMWHNQD